MTASAWLLVDCQAQKMPGHIAVNNDFWTFGLFSENPKLNKQT
jgi:hypothetical protein